MNVYINYQFNFGNSISHKTGVSEESQEVNLLVQQLEVLMNQVSAVALRETVFKLLMEFVVKHGESSRKEMKEVYMLLEFLKVLGDVQGSLVGDGK